MKEAQGDFLGAISLYLKGGLPARAAQVRCACPAVCGVVRCACAAVVIT